jgi:hypothetical protein
MVRQFTLPFHDASPSLAEDVREMLRGFDAAAVQQPSLAYIPWTSYPFYADPRTRPYDYLTGIILSTRGIA